MSTDSHRPEASAASLAGSRPMTPTLSPEASPPGGSGGDGLPPVNLDAILSPPTGGDELGWLAHYRVLKLLGRGGMGVVFLAEDTHLQRRVALKAILPEYASHPLARDRFLREARACAALKSDHIITIFQVGQDRDIPFMAMELLEGQTLEDRLIGEPLPTPDILRIGQQMADGLAAAHAAGIIHRDVKPANVWLEAPTGRVKLLDFGLARAADSRSGLTQTGTIIGTPDFMSPEQARGEDLDPRSDLFSLGAVLYAMCSGRNPFQGKSTMAVLTALAVETPRPAGELNPALPAALSELVDLLLKKDPNERPESAAAVSAALKSIAEGVAPTLPSPPRLSKAPNDQPRRSGSAVATQANLAGPTISWRLPGAAKAAPPKGFGTLGIVAATLLGVMLLAAAYVYFARDAAPAAVPIQPSGPPLRIGVLHSKSGTMAISERPVIDAVQFAVDELNSAGGVLGRPVEAIVADGQSDEAVFVVAAEKLIVEKKVCALFGCWTSASRKAVVPIIEKHGQALFYPVQYEGLEQSPHLVYGGPVPNQQILPALRWLVGFENRKRWFYVGSDYVFPVAAAEIVRAEAHARSCTIVGEGYLLLGGGGDAAALVQKIVAAKPDLIINAINGDSNLAFFRALRRAGLAAKDAPALSVSISEDELQSLGPKVVAGDYVASNYFQTSDSPANRAFMERWRARFGAESIVSAAMQTARNNVHLWAKAVAAAQKEEPKAVLAAVKGLQFEAPQGLIQIDPATQHTIQIARVGKLDEQGKLVEVFVTPQAIPPEPFPPPKSPDQWRAFLDSLHQRWGGRWSNPGP